MMDISKELKEYRKRKGLSQRELGRQAGLSSAYMCQLEKGFNPSAETVFKLANILGNGFLSSIFKLELPTPQKGGLQPHTSVKRFAVAFQASKEDPEKTIVTHKYTATAETYTVFLEIFEARSLEEAVGMFIRNADYAGWTLGAWRAREIIAPDLGPAEAED